MKIYIDDIRPLPNSSWTPALTYQEAISIIDANVGNIEEISFDHDLGLNSFVLEDGIQKEKTGYDVLLYIVQMKMDGKPVPKKFNVHSANPVGAARMQGVIERYLSE